ncbi:hypothetical protein [Clostridium thermobutyricum]|uniref:hypothetical protein n=1 Tax=Clostridium thermobutyricum TaxID=29372 RepID=UPI003F520C86
MKKNLLKIIVGGLIIVVCIGAYIFTRPKEEPWKYTTGQINTLKSFFNNQIAPNNLNLFTQLQSNNLTYMITENDYGENLLASLGICYSNYFNEMIKETYYYEDGKVSKSDYINDLVNLDKYITNTGQSLGYVFQVGSNEEIKNTLKPFDIILKYGSPYDKEKCKELIRIIKSFKETYNEYSNNYIQYDIYNGKINVLNINKLKYYADELNHFTKNIYIQNKEVASELQIANKNPVQI